MQKRSDDLKWLDLYRLLNGFVTGTKEKAILRLLRALAINYELLNQTDDQSVRKFKERINRFFDRLSLKGQNGSLFEKLYNKINDYGLGDDNFTLFIQELYKFWLLSDYADPDYSENIDNYTGGPEVLLYYTNKVLGFYNNPFKFEFVLKGSRVKIKVTKEEASLDNSRTNPGKGGPKLVREIKELGVYNLFHPITLADVPEEGEIQIPINRIPAFYLKAFDDKQRWSNIDKGIWLGVDVVTTVTGFGNLLKLRHLRHISKARKYFRLAIGIAEISSGTIGIILDYLKDNCENPELCERLREIVFWIEIASLGADTLTTTILRARADQFLEIAEETITDKRIIREIEKVSSRKKVMLRNTDLLGALGNKVKLEIIDQTGKVIGNLIRTTADGGRTLIFALEYSGKKVNLRSRTRLLNRNMGLEMDLPVVQGENILYGDFLVPSEITEEFSGFGEIMLDDALMYYRNNKKFGVVDGNFGLWLKDNIYYEGYSGQSVNLTKFWKSIDEGASIEDAAFSTFTGGWAKNNGFTNIKIANPVDDITKDKIIIKFSK